MNNNPQEEAAHRASQSYLGDVKWTFRQSNLSSQSDYYVLATHDQGQITATKNMLDNVGYRAFEVKNSPHFAGNMGATPGVGSTKSLRVSVETMLQMKESMPNLQVIGGPADPKNRQSAVGR